MRAGFSYKIILIAFINLIIHKNCKKYIQLIDFEMINQRARSDEKEEDEEREKWFC
jgi:hypothetical protein